MMEAEVIRLLSVERVQYHRQGCTDFEALERYSKYQDLRSALLTPISHTEVMLRNGLSERLDRRFGPHWYMAAGFRRLLADAQLDRLDQAIASLAGRAPTAPLVISHLSMGFWRYLLARRYDRELWTPTLRLAFVAGVKRDDVADRVEAIQDARNRVAHHKRLAEDPRETVRKCQFVVNCLSPHVSPWFLRATPEALRPV
jgi:hypothetical protein